MKNKTLLVISDGFPEANHYNATFVKSFVDLVNDEFKEVFVISPQPYFPKLLSKIKLFRKFTHYSGFSDYKYQNVKIFYPSFLMFPIRKFRQKRGNYFVEKCEKIIQKNNIEFDLIHTHFLFPSAYAGIKLNEKYKKPIIATVHGSDTYVEPFINKSNFNRAKNNLGKVDLITVPSEFLLEKIKEINPKAFSKTKIVSNFVDTNFFKPEKIVANTQKTILMVGNLIESKGILEIVPTVKHLLKTRKDFVVKVIGKGYLEVILKQQIQENKLGKYIKILGAKQNQKLVKYYNEADVLFFPSKAESFGIVQIEALACGVPVVAGANEGSKFLLKNYCGYISKNFKAEEFAFLLDKTINKQWDKKRMREYVISNFSVKKVKLNLLSLYKNLVK